MDDCLLVFSVFADKVLVVCGKVYHLDVCGYMIEDFGLLKEGALNLGQVIELDGVEVHLGTGNQQCKILLIGGHDGIFDEGVVFGLEVFFTFSELLHFFLLVMQVVINQH